jgi:hypothetical protein
LRKATDEEQSLKTVEADDESDLDITDIQQDLARDAARDVMNTSFEGPAVSPIKTHSVSKQRKISEARINIDRVCASIEERVAAGIDVDSTELKRKDPRTTIPSSIQAKATDLDTLTYLMKENLKTSDYKTKIQVLTITPESWSRKQEAEFFMCLSIAFVLQGN